MNKILVILFLLAATFSFAQEKKEGYEPIKGRPGILWYFNGFKAPKKGQRRKYDRLMVDILYNDWVGEVEPFKNNWQSIGANFNWMWDIEFSPKSTSSFGIGFSYGFWNIAHNGAFYPHEWEESTSFLKTQKQSVKRSTLKGHTFSVPIEFRFRTAGWRHFKVHIGFKAGYQPKMKNRDLYIKGQKVNAKLRDSNPFVYSTYIRIGVRNWALYAGFNINDLLLHSNSTKINHIQMGLTVSIF